MTCGGGRFRENLLFTHRGLSGPAILQISSYWNGKEPLVDRPAARASTPTTWLVGERASSARLDTILARRLPQRFAQQWCAAHDAALPMQAAAGEAAARARRAAARWPVLPSGTLGYNKAEVTLGGVDTRGLSIKTMAATSVPGLYFIGEVVDVTGWLGGYNFQWAWASGHAAGMHA